ncbi:MAG: hypothetical protein ABSH08_15720, partial [Tepidisphaeraceae bacterium]
MMNKLRIASILMGSVALAAPAFGSNIATVEGLASGTAATIGDPTNNDPPALITAILSQPGTFDTRTYSSWAILTNDGTGSLDVFGALPTGSTYVP